LCRTRQSIRWEISTYRTPTGITGVPTKSLATDHCLEQETGAVVLVSLAVLFTAAGSKSFTGAKPRLAPSSIITSRLMNLGDGGNPKHEEGRGAASPLLTG
jgi:hypothetical protein